jgi:Carboxypeptidase regulatory-like domain
MTRSTRTFFLTVAVVFAGSRRSSAQVRGMVADTTGVPVAGATVEAWTGLRRTESVRSDTGGRFMFATIEHGESVDLVVHRVGFRRLVKNIAASDTLVKLRLVPETVSLAGITATAETRGCPNLEEPRARALWEAARAKYAPVSDTMIFHSLATMYRGDRPRESIHDVGRGFRAWLAVSTGIWWVRWRRQIQVGGYAVRLNNAFNEQYALWQYAPLETDIAHHFTEPLFGELHMLSFAPSSEGEHTIRFCPRSRDRRRPEIEGTLTVGADTTFLDTRWRYTTPRPAEDAGGEVEFLPPRRRTGSLLLPERSLFWRLVPGTTRYHVEGASYEEWRLYPGKDAPPVPQELYAPADTSRDHRSP